MGYKKHKWGNYGVNYNRDGKSATIEIKDETERVIYKKFCQDKESYADAIKTVEEKFGWSPEVDVEDSPNFDKEKGWLNKDMNW